VTSDGTITDINREDYEKAEEDVIKELKEIGKPFIIIVNSKTPTSEVCLQITNQLKNKFDVPAVALNIDKMTQDDVNVVLKEALYEFPVAKIDLSLPLWVTKLNDDHYLKASLKESVETSIGLVRKIREIQTIGDSIKANEYVSSFEFTSINMETGYVNASIDVKEELFDKVLNELAGFEISNKSELLNMIQDYCNIKEEFETIRPALTMAKETGYGYTSINMKDLNVDKPELSKQGNRYGIKINANVPSWHIIKVDIDTSFEPIMGNKEQAEFLLNSLLQAYNESEDALLESQLFGRQVGDVLKDGVSMKLMMIPETNKIRLQNIVKTLSNKGKGTLIAFII
jgi:stage IV sporulation protein A